MCASRLRRLSQAVTWRLLVESNNFCRAIRGAEEHHFASRAAPASAPVGAASLFQENDAEPVFARKKKGEKNPAMCLEPLESLTNAPVAGQVPF